MRHGGDIHAYISVFCPAQQDLHYKLIGITNESANMSIKNVDRIKKD